MTYKKFLLSACVAALLGLSCGGKPAFAAGDNNIEDLMSMDIESLAKVEVSTASKKTEDISEAPSVVSVITSEDIRRYGANNLNDILDRATSIQTYGSSYYPNNIVSIRAGALQIQNNHVLFLINGRPFRDSLTGGTVTELLMGFPLTLIDAIEIIRGPGSVLYGSGAFDGVINIKTKSAEKIGNGIVSATYGSFNTGSTDDAAAMHGKDWNLIAGVKKTRDRGWDESIVDGLGTRGTFKTDDDDFGFMTSGNYKDFTFNFFRAKALSRNLNPNAQYPVSRNGIPATFVDLGHALHLNDKWTLNSNVTYNEHRFYSASNGRTFKSHDILLEESARGALTDKLGVLAGASFENHESAQFNAPANTQWYTSYLQFEHQTLSWLKLVGGVQMNKPVEMRGASYSPRLAAIAKFDQNWGMKVMYGQAFRSPNFVETSINSPGIIVGNHSLAPETIQTTEAQLFYSAPKYQGSLTAYYSEMEDLIVRSPAPPFPILFSNGRSIIFHGVEFEGKANLTKEVSLTGNAAYQMSKNNLGQADSTYSPNFMFKAGITWDSPKGVTLGLYENYFGDPSRTGDFIPTSVARNPEPAAYHLVTFNASGDIRKLTGNNAAPAATVSLFVDNLLNERARFPDLNNGSVNSVPIHSGRAVYGSVAVKF